jgi:hypothetical protein
MNHWDFGQPAEDSDATAVYSAARPGPAPRLFADDSAPEDSGPESDEPWTDDYWDGPEGWAVDGGDGDGSGEDRDWSDAAGAVPYPITFERATSEDAVLPVPGPVPAPTAAEGPARAAAPPWDRQSQPDWPTVEDWNLAPSDGRRGRSPAAGTRGRRWLLLAGVCIVAAGAGAGVALATRGHPAAHSAAQGATQGAAGGLIGGPAVPGGTMASATAPAAAGGTGGTGGTGAVPVTMPQAQAVMAAYTEAKNGADARRDDAMLAMAETGSSEAIDAGFFREQRGIGAAPVAAYGPLRMTYYLPRSEPGGGPRWFAVAVANSFFASPHTVSSTEYLLFTQAAPGGRWLDAVEPYLLAGTGSSGQGSAGVPRPVVGPDGYATAVDPGAASPAVAPGQLPALTAASLDGTGSPAGIGVPGSLSDLRDERFWRRRLPTATVTDTHAPAGGSLSQVYALLTADGGALVFYTDAAELTITPAAGTALHLTVPGFYHRAKARPRAAVSYLEQFAVYDPPKGAASASPSVVADYAGITAAH